MLEPLISVPTLSEWGLIAMVAVIGIAAAFTLHKRYATDSK
jgi:hypothetical protein